MSLTNPRSVPFFNYSKLFGDHHEEYLKLFVDVGKRGAFIAQRDLVEFEEGLKRYTGSKFALGVANGTDALIIALRAAGIGAGDEVIFASHTFVATAASIHFAGAIPVPVECSADHLIDPESVERAITPRTRAIMPTQLNGRTANMEALQAIADKHGLLIVEDSAQGLGAKFKGKQAGTFGIAGTISFYPAKNLGCLGDGGAILTSDERLFKKMLALRDHGRGETGEVECWGLNSRLDNLQAAFLNAKLARYDEIIAERRKFASLYQEYLGGLSELTLPPAPDEDPRYFDVYQNYEIEADRRDELREHLKQNGVGTLIQWGGKAVHQFAGLHFTQKLPYTEKLFTRMLMLPMNNTMVEADVEYVAHQVRRFYRG